MSKKANWWWIEYKTQSEHKTAALLVFAGSQSKAVEVLAGKLTDTHKVLDTIIRIVPELDTKV